MLKESTLKVGSGILKEVSNTLCQKGKYIVVILDGIEIFKKSLSNRFNQKFITADSYETIEDPKQCAIFKNGVFIKWNDPHFYCGDFKKELKIKTNGNLKVFFD